jgi:ABC-type phosphate transport system permease subunit
MAAAGIGLQCLSALLIAAHFLRSGQIVLATFCLLAPLLFLYRRRASLIALQMFSGMAVVIWLYTAGRLVMVRMAQGQSWKTAATLLVTVALASLVATLLLNGESIRAKYPKH